MSQAQPEGDPQPEKETFYEAPVWKRFYAFLLGPALMAAAALAVFTVVSVVTEENQSVGELVKAVKDGGKHRRWQAAFALTKYLQPSVTEQDTKLLRETDASYKAKIDSVRGHLPELLRAYDAPTQDPEVKRFLAAAFGYLGDPRALPALLGSLEDRDAELVHHALVAVATFLDLQGEDFEPSEQLLSKILETAARPEADIQATAIYVLGILGTDRAVEHLERSVDGTAAAVRWNAAFGLARHNNSAGENVIAEILDRGALYRAAGPDQAKQGVLFLNAVRSAGMLRSPMLLERLARIAKSDENLRARDMAMKLLRSKG